MKIAYVVTTRGSWGKLKLLAEKTDSVLILKNYKPVTSLPYLMLRFWSYDDSPLSILRIMSACLEEFAVNFDELKPKLVVLVGDRFETLTASCAAHILGIPIVHLEGGEVSGTLDNKMRYCISELATYHFPCTERAADILKSRGYDNVFNVGATSLDVIKDSKVNPQRPFLLVVHHPDTSNPDGIKSEFQALYDAVISMKISVCWIGPNMDLGWSQIRPENVKFFRYTHIENYGEYLRNASCIVGNSSSGIREAAFFGTPSVSIGSRQKGRESGKNVIRCEANKDQIMANIAGQIAHGPYEPDYLYGDGTATEKILEVIKCILA